MSAVYQNVRIEQGANFKISISVTEADGTVKDLTGYTPSGQIRSFDFDTLYADLTDYIDITTPDEGLVDVDVPGSVTDLYTFNLGRYDIEVTDGTETLRIIEGYASLSPQVTVEEV